MKIVCESCGAKYSIADDRVTGKVFKIRCKRCSEVIIVRGDQQAQQSEEPASTASAGDGTTIWHIVVDGEQAGPYSPQQLGEMLTAQTVDWDAYVWTEGFDNWLPMREVTDLVSQITGQGAQAQAAPQQAAGGARAAAYRSAVHETLSGQPSMGADPFAEDSAANEPGLFGNGSASSGPDLFARGARSAASPFGAGGGDDAGVVASAPSPRMAAEQAMTGARNENSVLFSLKNLQALATGSGGSATSLPPSTVGAGSTGYASGEGSGLIDIRALATTTGMGENAGGGGARDELLSIGSAGGAFGSLGSPMLAPVSDDGDSSKKMLIWAGVAAIAIVSAAAVAVIYFTRSPVPQQPAVAMLPQAAPANTVAAAQPPAAEAAPAAAEKPSEGELAARAAAATGDDPSQPRERSGSSDDREGRRRRESKGEDSTPAPAAAAPEKPAAPSKPSGPRSIDDLLDGALSGSSSSKGGKPAESSAARSDLPETPSRDQVMSAMNGVKSAVQACGAGSGVATVTVSVAGETGRVTNAQVGGVTGPGGSCIAQAVRKAQFPKFKNKVFKVSFPFKL